MKTTIRFKHVAPSLRGGVREYLESLGQQYLDQHLVDDHPPPVLNANLDQDLHRRVFRVTLRLSLHGNKGSDSGARNLVAREQDGDLLVALQRAAESLEWRMRRYRLKQRVRHAHEVRGQDERWRELEPALDLHPSDTKRNFVEFLLPQLDRLTGFVARERAYLQADDRLAQDYPSSVEVLDEVLVRALEDPPVDQAPDRVSTWLHQLAIEVLADYVEEHRAQQLESVPLEETSAPGIHDADLADDGWLDEELGLVELLPAKGDDAFEAVNRLEAQRQALTLIRTLPTRWRRVISFHYFDELPIETIAETLRMPRDEVRAIAEAALEFLRERLRDQGIDVVDAGWPADYVIAPPGSRQGQSVADELRALAGLTAEGSV